MTIIPTLQSISGSGKRLLFYFSIFAQNRRIESTVNTQVLIGEFSASIDGEGHEAYTEIQESKSDVCE